MPALSDAGGSPGASVSLSEGMAAPLGGGRGGNAKRRGYKSIVQQNIWTQVSHSDCFLVFCFISLLFIFPSHTHALCKTACPENHPSLQMNTGCAVSVFSFYVLLTAQHHMGSPHQLPEELGTVLQQWPPWGLLLWVLLSASTKWNKVASMKVCGIPAFISLWNSLCLHWQRIWLLDIRMYFSAPLFFFFTSL